MPFRKVVVAGTDRLLVAPVVVVVVPVRPLRVQELLLPVFVPVPVLLRLLVVLLKAAVHPHL